MGQLIDMHYKKEKTAANRLGLDVTEEYTLVDGVYYDNLIISERGQELRRYRVESTRAEIESFLTADIGESEDTIVEKQAELAQLDSLDIAP